MWSRWSRTRVALLAIEQIGHCAKYNTMSQATLTGAGPYTLPFTLDALERKGIHTCKVHGVHRSRAKCTIHVAESWCAPSDEFAQDIWMDIRPMGSAKEEPMAMTALPPRINDVLEIAPEDGTWIRVRCGMPHGFQTSRALECYGGFLALVGSQNVSVADSRVPVIAMRVKDPHTLLVARKQGNPWLDANPTVERLCLMVAPLSDPAHIARLLTMNAWWNPRLPVRNPFPIHVRWSSEQLRYSVECTTGIKHTPFEIRMSPVMARVLGADNSPRREPMLLRASSVHMAHPPGALQTITVSDGNFAEALRLEFMLPGDGFLVDGGTRYPVQVLPGRNMVAAFASALGRAAVPDSQFHVSFSDEGLCIRCTHADGSTPRMVDIIDLFKEPLRGASEYTVPMKPPTGTTLEHSVTMNERGGLCFAARSFVPAELGECSIRDGLIYAERYVPVGSLLSLDDRTTAVVVDVAEDGGIVVEPRPRSGKCTLKAFSEPRTATWIASSPEFGLLVHEPFTVGASPVHAPFRVSEPPPESMFLHINGNPVGELNDCGELVGGGAPLLVPKRIDVTVVDAHGRTLARPSAIQVRCF